MQKSLQVLGTWPYHPPDDTPIATPEQISKILKLFRADNKMFGAIRNILQPPQWRRETVALSRPDVYLLNPAGPTIIIEVKAMSDPKKVAPSIHPSEISDGQRQWLDNWTYISAGLGFLGVGTVSGKPRRFWLIPWEEWVDLEFHLQEKTFDFRISTDDLDQRWPEKPYELKWEGKGMWSLPRYHPILAQVDDEKCPPKEWKKEQRSLRFSKPKGG